MAAGSKGAPEKRLTGWHVLIWIGGFFGVMFIANGFFVYYARTTWPGVVESSPYQASQNYNKTLAEASAQDARDWSMGLEFKRRQNAVFVVVTARDTLGNPIENLTINARIGRPATETFDTEVTLEPSGDGLYQGSVGTLDPGRWRISLEALERREVKFQSIDTVTLK